MENNAVIFGLSASKELAKKISKKTKIELGDSNVHKFADGEINFRTNTSVRNKIVFIVQSTSKSVNENLMELLIFIDLLKRASVKEVNVIIPYFGYSRQDRKNIGRQPITAALVSKMIEIAGANRVIAFDLHSSQIQGFFSIPVDELKAVGILSKKLSSKVVKNSIVVSPDHGGVARARHLAKILNLPIAIIDKRRSKPNQVEEMKLIGNVEDKNALIIDDIIDTGGTICKSIKLLKENGVKDIYVIATHGIFSNLEGEPNDIVIKKIKEAGAKEIIVTNSIDFSEKEKGNEDILKVCDLTESISAVITSHLRNESITDYFIKKYNTIL